MHKLSFASLMLVASCGGGSSAPVDPASVDACLAWANGVCRMAYACVDTAAQDAAFHALYGTSNETCWDGLSKRCTSNQPAGSAFGPSCGPGKTVNQAALTACEDNLQSMFCADWTASPAGGCENLCGAKTISPDAGTSAGGSVATPEDFCNTSGSLSCERGFECDPVGAADAFGNLAGCKGYVAYECAGVGSGYCPNGYSASLAQTCIKDIQTASCAVVLGSDEPPSCVSACSY